MKKTNKVILTIIGIIVAIRLILPSVFLKLANNQLAEMDGYTGSMQDLDLHLYKGAYQFEGIEIEKVDAQVKTPFVKIKEVDISIDWNAILQGKLVGEIEMLEPSLNFAIDSTAEVTQTGIEHNWLQTLKDLVPIEVKLNEFSVSKGKLVYSDYSEKPYVEEAISNIEIVAHNLSNATENKNPLPSSFKMTGKADGNGDLIVKSDLNIMKEIPDFDMDIEIKRLDLTQLNDFTEAYSNFDFQSGKFHFYSEIVMKNGSYKGYIKPMFESVKIFDKNEEKQKKFTRKLWEKSISIGAEILENQPKDRLAAKVPVKGDLEESNANAWASAGSVLKNAFIAALPMQIEETVSF